MAGASARRCARTLLRLLTPSALLMLSAATSPVAPDAPMLTTQQHQPQQSVSITSSGRTVDAKDASTHGGLADSVRVPPALEQQDVGLIAGQDALMRREVTMVDTGAVTTALGEQVPGAQNGSIQGNYGGASSSFTMRNHMPDEQQTEEELPSGVVLDGDFVKVFEPFALPDQETKQVMTEEENDVCMHELGLSACMERYGSYGIRRLVTESFEEIRHMDWERKDWMNHPKVQKKPVMSVTFPMSHASGSYDVVGASNDPVGQASTVPSLAQNLDVFQQLSMGVRALDIEVALSTGSGQPFATHGGLLNVPLATILEDVKAFINLDGSDKEVIVISLKKAPPLPPGQMYGTIAPLVEEENDPRKVPGQQVHLLVGAILNDTLALHQKLETLASQPSSINNSNNPKISQLVAANARILYFWEGQQVLCVSLEECRETPGWAASHGAPFAFGPPQHIDVRRPEPFCLQPTGGTVNTDIVTLVRNLQGFLLYTSAYVPAPLCFPDGTADDTHVPPVMLQADAYATLPAEELSKLVELLDNDREDYTQGEPLTARTVAERMNYLLMAWIFKEKSATGDFRGSRGMGKNELFMNANFISMDYVHPVIVHRTIEENQGLDKCNIAIHCMESGGCFAMSLRTSGGDCQAVEYGQELIIAHAFGDVLPESEKEELYFMVALLVLIVLCIIYVFVSPYKIFPSCEVNGMHCAFFFRAKAPPSDPNDAANDEAKEAPEMASMDGAGAAPQPTQAKAGTKS